MILKFEKTGTSALVAHVDTLRAVSYAFRRSGIQVAFSQGYNPHMEMSFSSPIPLGVNSLCEYVNVSSCDTLNVLDRINAVCPKGLRFTKVYGCDVNLASKLNRATYVIKLQGIGNVIDEILSPNYEISYVDKGNVVTKDVSARIFFAQKLDENTAKVIFATGNDNLRPDRVAVHLQNKHNLQGDYSVVKTEMWVDDVNADNYLANA